MEPKTFALLGASGHIAREHVRTIHECGGMLVAACDSVVSCGYLDRWYPGARFFTDELVFFDYLREVPPDYIVVCTPSDLHVRQSLDAIRIANVICEKPFGLSLDAFDAASKLISQREEVTGHKLYLIQQRRYLPWFRSASGPWTVAKRLPVDITFHSPRGAWYGQSWKATRSGGLLLNIGCHPFDLVTLLFGDVEHVTDARWEGSTSVAGEFVLPRADVTFSLSIRSGVFPTRNIVIDGVDYPLDFLDLHVFAYRDILAGRGVRLDTCRSTMVLIDMLSRVRV